LDVDRGRERRKRRCQWCATRRAETARNRADCRPAHQHAERILVSV